MFYKKRAGVKLITLGKIRPKVASYSFTPRLVSLEIRAGKIQRCLIFFPTLSMFNREHLLFLYNIFTFDLEQFLFAKILFAHISTQTTTTKVLPAPLSGPRGKKYKVIILLL